MKTLIVTGVHQAEAEFGERVIEKYKELYGVPDSVKIFAVPENKGSNHEDIEKEVAAYAQVVPVIKEHSPGLIIDIHNGFKTLNTKGAYYITLFYDAFHFTDHKEVDALYALFLEKRIHADGCGDLPEHELIRNMGARCIGIETKLCAFADWSEQDKLSGQALHNFLAASAKKNNRQYNKAVEHTAKVTHFLHTEFPERFPRLFQSTLLH
jgi:hypothetical protein